VKWNAHLARDARCPAHGRSDMRSLIAGAAVFIGAVLLICSWIDGFGNQR
jgi:hypothetical protein